MIIYKQHDYFSLGSLYYNISSRMWLRFSLRCKLRILSIIHKSIYYFTPSYFSDLIRKRQILGYKIFNLLSIHYQNALLSYHPEITL